MCVCVCVCMFLSTYMYIYVYVYIIYTYMYVYVHIFIFRVNPGIPPGMPFICGLDTCMFKFSVFTQLSKTKSNTRMRFFAP